MPINHMMVFLRTKKIKRQNYYYIVQAHRENGKIKQKVLMYIGNANTMLKKLRIANEVLKKKKS